MQGPEDLVITDALRATRALAHRLETEFLSWGRRETSTAPSSARVLARLTLGIARRMLVELELLEESYRNGVVPDLESVVALNQRACLAEKLHALLDTSTNRILHPALSPTVRTELGTLGIKGEVLVCGTRDISYEVETFTRDYFLDLVSEAELNQCDWPLLVFRVPNAPIDWPLNHVLLYHEIGHALVKPGQLVLPPLPSDLDPNQAQDLIKRMERAELAQNYTAYLKSWMEEVYADAVGVLLAGPAYLLSFCRFLGVFFQIDMASDSHPPVGLRIHLLGKILRESGFYSNLPEGMRALLDVWLSRVEALHLSSAQGYRYEKSNNLFGKALPFLIRAMETMHSGIVAQARASVGAEAYSIEWFKADQERGRALSELKIPPIEVDEIPTLSGPGTPLQPARIFSISWAGYLEETSESAPAEMIAARSTFFAEAMLGALDAAEALRAWRSPS